MARIFAKEFMLHVRRTYSAYTTRKPTVNSRTRRISVFIRLWASPDIFLPVAFRHAVLFLRLRFSHHYRQPARTRDPSRGDPRILNSPWSHMSHEIKRFRGTTWGGFAPHLRGNMLQLNVPAVKIINPELMRRDNVEHFCLISRVYADNK